jgi:hypothetical protein
MDGINWTQVGDKYYLDTSYGRAHISEEQRDSESESIGGSGSHQFIARFEGSDGSIKEAKHPFYEFEHAEGWLLFGVVMGLDQPQDDLPSERRLFDTLDLCRQMLPASTPPSHFRRLELIKQVFTRSRCLKQIASEVGLDGLREKVARGEWSFGDAPVILPRVTEPLDWQQQDNECFVKTEYGKAVIIETRSSGKWVYSSSVSHTPCIEHSTGIVVKGSSSIDFETAERWILDKFNELDHPTGGEADLENLQFTLHICAKMLPADSDPIHFIRLRWIETRIADILL